MIRSVGMTMIVLLTLIAGSAAAAAPGSVEPQRVRERPDPAGTATEISLGLYLFDIDEIDDAQQRFSVDLIFTVRWRDPRLALPEDQRSGRYRTMSLDDIWNPRGLIINDRGLTPQLPRTVDIDDFGNVEYTQRLAGELAADLQFEEFPFDAQLLPIDIVSYQYTPEEVRFALDTAISGDDGSFSAEGWQFRLLEPSIGTFSVPAEDVVRPRLTYYIEAERNTRYYLWTMFLPMTLIVFMSWTAFWLQPNLVPPRVGISTASVFSLIALGFSIRLSLPPVPYLTRGDAFVVGCTLLVFLSLAVTVIGSRWASAERLEAALRLNAVSRWAYAALYFLVVAVALLR